MLNPDRPIGCIAADISNATGERCTQNSVLTALGLLHLSSTGIRVATAAILLSLSEPYVRRLSRRWGIAWADYTPFQHYEARGLTPPVPLLTIGGVEVRPE